MPINTRDLWCDATVLCLQVNYARSKGVPYGDGLFQQLAQDFFHLPAPPEGITKAADLPAGSDTQPRPDWWDRINSDADPARFHADAVRRVSQ